MQIHSRTTIYVLGFTLSLICVGCGGPDAEMFPALETELIWPAPPEQPRIKYVGMLSTEGDLKRKRSRWEGLVQLVFGKEELGVLLNPYAVAVDEADRLFVADTAGAVIHIYDLKTRAYGHFSALGEGEALTMPVGITLLDENIYVSDSVLRKVCVFDREGEFRFAFGSDRLKRPSGIASCSQDKRVFVADTLSHTIDAFNENGEYEYSIGSRGLEAGYFNFPTHICIDASGLLYVSDTLNYRVQVFSRDGKFLRMFGRQGDRPGYFAHPCGIATDGFGHVYVTDRQFENVQIFDNDGQILMAFGEEGTEPGEFWLPAGLFIDNRNRIYVADSFNKRIQIFQLLRTQEGNAQK